MTFHSNPSWDPHQPREVDQFPYVRRSAVGGYGSQSHFPRPFTVQNKQLAAWSLAGGSSRYPSDITQATASRMIITKMDRLQYTALSGICPSLCMLVDGISSVHVCVCWTESSAEDRPPARRLSHIGIDRTEKLI